jgi:hypothetical protein
MGFFYDPATDQLNSAKIYSHSAAPAPFVALFQGHCCALRIYRRRLIYELEGKAYGTGYEENEEKGTWLRKGGIK